MEFTGVSSSQETSCTAPPTGVAGQQSAIYSMASSAQGVFTSSSHHHFAVPSVSNVPVVINGMHHVEDQTIELLQKALAQKDAQIKELQTAHEKKVAELTTELANAHAIINYARQITMQALATNASQETQLAEKNALIEHLSKENKELAGRLVQVMT